MSTAPAAAMPVLRKLHGVPTALGSFATNGTGAGFGSPNTRTPSDVAPHERDGVEHALRERGVVECGRGAGVVERLDVELHVGGGIVLGRLLGEEVAPHEHDPRVGGS